MKRLATCPPSKTQSTVSPPKTVATFSSAGRRIKVDWSSAARTTGGVADSETVTVRGASGERWCTAVLANEGVVYVRPMPRKKRIGTGGFTEVSFLF
jgi:hypothetical protein